MKLQISEETRRKMSESHRGPRPWMKGRHFSEEARKNMSEAHKGIKQSEESNRKRSKTMAGRPSPLKGKNLSDETKRKMSESRRGKLNSFYGKHHSDEAKVKNRLAHKGTKHSEETKEKMSKAHLKFWKNPIWRENQIKAILKGSNIRPTRPEREMKKVLNKLFPNEYKYVGDGSILIGYKNPDFINVNGQKKIIELFGDYWHSNKITGLKKKEHRKQRQSHFAKYGYKTLVIWEHELQNKRRIKEKLMKFHA